jgi:hypothetical protein
MVVDPDNGDEQVAHRIADGRGTGAKELRLPTGPAPSVNHNSHDHYEDRV